MSLNFRPERLVYDPVHGLLRFFATDGAMLVRCAISKDALLALDDGSSLVGGVLDEIYRRHRARIQELTQQKYRAALREPKRGVVLMRSDLAN